MLGVVIQIDGYDPVTGAAVTLRAASRDEVALCHLNGETWWPTIAKLPTLRYDLFDGAFGGQITAPTSALTLAVEPWPEFARYSLADARFRLWTGAVGTDWSGYTLRFDGRVFEQPTLKNGLAEVAFGVDDRWLDAALLPTYTGTTGLEGPAALKGQAKPLSLGAPRYVAGTLIDSVNSVFQVSFGAIQGVEVALERLARFGPPVGNHPTYAALVAANVPRGTWATCLAFGLVRFGAPPEGQISFLVQGDASGPDGWARLPGRLIRRLAVLSGGTGKIDLASLVALDMARPYNLSLYLDGQSTARQLIQQLAASVNAVAGVSWTGQLFVVPVGLSAPTITLAADGSSLPPVASVDQVGIAAPWAKLAIGAERAWTVHALGDIAFNAQLIDLGAYDGGTTYREGNIVQYQGSSWLYQNPSPTKGNVPPVLPVEQDDFWRVLAKAGAAGRDGTSAVALKADGPVDIVANSAVKRPTSSAADYAQVSSATGFKGGAVLSFTLPDGDHALAFGLSTNPAFDPLPTNLDLGFEFTPFEPGKATISVRERGNTINLGMTMGGAFQIHYDNSRVRYLYNDSVVYEHAATADVTFYVDSAFTTPGAKVADISFAAAGAKGDRGEDAPLIKTQWSANGVDGWHDSFANGDKFFRQSNDNGASYGPAIRAVGEGGSVGVDGTSSTHVFTRSVTVPPTPDPNTGDPPPGWYDGPPAGVAFLWLSTATYRGTVQEGAWSTPQRISGDNGTNGTDGFIADSDVPVFAIECYSNGTAKPSWTGGRGSIRLTKGGAVITAGVTYAIGAQSNIASLTLDGNTFSFAGLTADVGYFVINAIYAGTAYSRVISVKKVRDGSAAFRSQAAFGPATGSVTGSGNTTVPQNRTVTIAGNASYSAPTPGASQTTTAAGILGLYWRNMTDGGPLNFLGEVEGSIARSVNRSSNASEPDIDGTRGEVSASFSFASPSPDKQIEYSAQFRSKGAASAEIFGNVALEIVS